MYPGKKLPRTEIALLSVPSTSTLHVDGTLIERKNISRLELLPGDHTIEWEFEYSNRYAEIKELGFYAEPGATYRLEQRFFPAPFQGGPIEAVLGLALELTVTPLMWIFPPEPAGDAPHGDYFMWIIDQQSRDILAGMTPEVPQEHNTITFVPVE